MQASKDMEELLKRIYMPSVFYFPKALFPDLTPKAKKELDEYHFFEDLGVLKVDGDVGSLKKLTNTLEISKKDNVLEGNIFQLLELKERLKQESFRFLLEKYISHVKTWIYAYKWLLDNFDKQIPETDKNQKSLFEYQCVVLDDHLTKLTQKFQFNINRTERVDLVEVLKDNNRILPQNQPLYNNLIQGVKEGRESKKQQSEKQTKKQILLTEYQADDFLLKTVFNVKLN